MKGFVREGGRVGPAVRQRRPAAKGLRLAQAACGGGAAYAAVSVYWARGGAWLLDTIGGTLERSGRAGNPGIMLAGWGAPGLKGLGAIRPPAGRGGDARPGTHARGRP